MEKRKDSQAFLIFGYTEDSNGVLSGPRPVGRESSLKRASTLCLALLWHEKYKWHALTVQHSGREVVTYRRFPPLRVKEVLQDGVFIRQTGSSESPDSPSSRGRGARLAISASGRRQKSFGGSHA